MSPELKALLIAAVLGVLVGGGATLGLAKVTPSAVGFFAFAAFLLGVQVAGRRWRR